MKKLLVLCTAFLLLAFTNKSNLKNKILGHWSTDCFMGVCGAGDSVGVGDTIVFTKTKYSDKLYHWGGGASSGIEFKGDSDFVQYQNVLCSDETDTKIGFEEKFYFVGDSVIEVKSMLRNFRFKILRINTKKLSIKILGPVVKE